MRKIPAVSILIMRPARAGLVATTAAAIAIGLMSPPSDVAPPVVRVEIAAVQLELLVSSTPVAEVTPTASAATIDGWIVGWIGFAASVVLTPVFFPILWVGASVMNKINGIPVPSLAEFIPQYVRMLGGSLSQALGVPAAAAAQSRSAAVKPARGSRSAVQPARPSRKATAAKSVGEKKSGRGGSARPSGTR